MIGKVANNAHIHINGYLNVVVDNFVQGENSTQPGGISVTSQLKMYNSYALSNRIVGNSAAFLYFGGDGGCDDDGAELLHGLAPPHPPQPQPQPQPLQKQRLKQRQPPQQPPQPPPQLQLQQRPQEQLQERGGRERFSSPQGELRELVSQP